MAMILVANNPYDSPLLHTQLLSLYSEQKHYSHVVVLCNGGPVLTAETDGHVTQETQIRSFRISRFGFINLTYLFFIVLGYALQSKDNHFHLRGFVVAIVFHLATLLGLIKRKFIYDPRGAFLIEKSESGSPVKFFSPLLKLFEARLIGSAKSTIVTSRRFKSLFEAEYGNHEGFAVIYNNSAIPVSEPKDLSQQDDINVVYMGTINYWHDIDEVFRIFLALQGASFGSRFKFHIATHKKFHPKVTANQAASKLRHLDVTFVQHTNLATYLEGMHVGVSVVRPTRSSSIASPIKISDYISAGLIILANRGIGDFDAYYEERKSALLYDYKEDFDPEALLAIDAGENRSLLSKLSTETATTSFARILSSLHC